MYLFLLLDKKLLEGYVLFITQYTNSQYKVPANKSVAKKVELKY